MTGSRVVFFVGVIFFLAVIAGRGPARAQQAPVFRSGVDLITVDLTVLDRNGRPIQGLGPDDFVLKVRGERRRVVSAHYIAQLSASLAPADTAVVEHYSSNEHVDRGRLILVAVDQGNIRRVDGTRALRAAGKFIDALHPDDRVAAMQLKDVGPVQFTRNHRAVREVLERLVGEDDPVTLEMNIGLSEALEIGDGNYTKLDQVVLRECGAPIARLQDPARIAEREGMRDPCPNQVEAEARAISQHVRMQAHLSLRALRLLVERLKAIEGPKTLVLLSEGLVAEPRMFDLTELGAAAQSARVTIYVLQLDVPVFEAAQTRRSPTVFEDVRLRADGLARLAGAARGALFYLVGSDPRPFRRIATELAGYYLLAFEPRDTDRDGRFHRIDVSVKRRRATLRGRDVFRVDPEQQFAGALEERLAELLRAPRLATELPLRFATYVYREPDTDKVRIVVGAETDGLAPGAGRSALADPDVLFGFVLLDDQNIIAASGAQAAAGRHAFSAIVPAGDYTLKLAAVDRLGRRGSAERRFGAELASAGALQVSELMLARMPERSNSLLQPIVDRAPGGRVLAYLELYTDRPPLPHASVRLEVASGDAAAAVLTVPAVVTRREDRWSIARAVLPIAALPAGRYVARAQISAPSQPVQRVVRPFTVAK